MFSLCSPLYGGDLELFLPQIGSFSVVHFSSSYYIAPSQKEKSEEKSFVSLFSTLGMINGNFRDCLDSVVETAIFTKTFPLPSKHTYRLHFPASLPVKGGLVRDTFWPGEVSHFQVYSIKTCYL